MLAGLSACLLFLAAQLPRYSCPCETQHARCGGMMVSLSLNPSPGFCARSRQRDRDQFLGQRPPRVAKAMNCFPPAI
jgi:hypothetical protein